LNLFDTTILKKESVVILKKKSDFIQFLQLSGLPLNYGGIILPFRLLIFKNLFFYLIGKMSCKEQNISILRPIVI